MVAEGCSSTSLLCQQVAPFHPHPPPPLISLAFMIVSFMTPLPTPKDGCCLNYSSFTILGTPPSANTVSRRGAGLLVSCPPNELNRYAEPLVKRLVAGFQTRRPGFEPGSSYVGFVVDKVALGQAFSDYFGSPCQSSFH
jgi:hypothetical protein